MSDQSNTQSKTPSENNEISSLFPPGFTIPDQNVSISRPAGVHRAIWCQFDDPAQGWRIKTVEKVSSTEPESFRIQNRLLRIVIEDDRNLKCGRYCNPRSLLGL